MNVSFVPIRSLFFAKIVLHGVNPCSKFTVICDVFTDCFPSAELFVPPFVAGAYGLLHFKGFCLRFQLASDKFARDALLRCERLSFIGQKAMFCMLKRCRLKL